MIIGTEFLSWVAWESNWEPVSNQVMGFLSVVQSTHDSSWDLHFVSVVNIFSNCPYDQSKYSDPLIYISI